MKLLHALKNICFTTFTCFTLLVYILYLLRSAVPSTDNAVLSLSYLNGFLLFGFLLGLTNQWLANAPMEKILKRLLHLALTAVNFFVSITWITGYLTAGNELHSPLAVPNRILYCGIAFIVLYFICLGIGALFKKLVSLTQKSDEYHSVLSK